MKSKLLALLLLSSCLGLPASAQVASDDNTSTEITSAAASPSDDKAGINAMVEKVNIITRASAVTELPENDPIPLDLGLVEVPGVSNDLTKGVTAKAYARYVSVDDMKIGQLVLSSVGKGDRVEVLNSDNFVAQFDLTQPALDPSSPISIEGNKEELKAALERLAAQQEEPEDDNEEEVADSGVGASKGNVGSNASSNPDASGYSSPAGLDVGEAPKITSDITTEGCEIRVDLDQLQAIQQTRVVTTTDGSPEYGECADGAERFKINQSFAVCSYDENIETMKATAQFMYYYTDGGGNREEIGDCQPDPEKVFDITEDRDACTVYLDYLNEQAIPQGKLVYTNHNGKVVPITSCAASIEIDPSPMEETTEGCDIRDDFIAGKSFGRSKYVYTLEGQDWDTLCQDNDEEYPHSTIYKTSGGDQVCDPIINRDSGKVTLQSRVMINVNGFELYRTPCTPDTDAKDIQSTTSGCENPAHWTHNISSGQSIGSERFYYLLDGLQEPVTECQDNGVVYPHQQELTGWQPHDAQLFAYRLVTVYIENVETVTGRYNILTSQVLPGDPQVPYTYVGKGPAVNGEYFYEECTRFDERDEVERYRRPDESVHKVVLGPADPLELGNKCFTDIDWGEETHDRFDVRGLPRPMNSGTYGPSPQCGYSSATWRKSGENSSGSWSSSGSARAASHCAFTDVVATKTIVREDGEIIGQPVDGTCRATTSGQSLRTYNNGHHIEGYYWYPPYPDHTHSIKSGCLAQWGWQ